MDMEEVTKLFIGIGLSELKAKETIKNSSVSAHLKNCIDVGLKFSPNEISKAHGMLLYHIATKIKPQTAVHIPLLSQYVVEGKMESELRLNAAMEYLLTNPLGDVDMKAFEESFGCGVVVTPDQIEAEVARVINSHRAELVEKRYRYNVFPLMSEVRNTLKWADGKHIKAEIDLMVLDVLGPKTEADLAPLPKADKSANKPSKVKAAAAPVKTHEAKESEAEVEKKVITMAEVLKNANFHLPGENYKTDGYVITDNTMDLLKQHLKITGGQVRTRFPPEPNGILHIGHAKAININFGYAAAHNGLCNLRYDDTNPEKEEEKFFIGIKDMVQWLGYKPAAITYSSDNFDQLYDWAKILIRKEKAYVCHQKSEDMKGFNPIPSPWRERPADESLQLFDDMKNGLFDEGAATLRMKLTLEEGKLDPVAYRIKYVAHHRTGDRWCIYPTYDYTHCLCDSIEHITHSLCTKEFQSRRSSYYWLCNAVDIYSPVQWEYGRLNVYYTVVSKRKIAKLITENIVADWDDPRLFTLTALRRRGFPYEAINEFCANMGLTGAQASVDPQNLEAVVAATLDRTAPRTMVVLNPLKVTILNYTGPTSIEVPDFPKSPELGSHQVTLGSVIFIDHSDFSEVEEPGYRRLKKNQPVGLRHAGLVISVEKVKKNANGEIVELEVKCLPSHEVKKPKGFIHWVSDPIPVEVRLYERLFVHKNPEDTNEVPGGFLSDINPNSLSVHQSLADNYISSAQVYSKFQFERVGYFSVDTNSTDKKLVFNRTVLLKEDSNK